MAAREPSAGKARINLEKVSALFVEDASQGLDLLAQIFAGFGVRTPHRATSTEGAMHIVRSQEIDLIVVDAVLQGESSGYDFIRDLRRSKLEPACFVPVILVEGHTRFDQVSRARDCGANFVVAKPLTPRVLLDRVLWVARESRPFVDAGLYVGPDRRFQNTGPPAGTDGRRRTDLPPEIGEAVTPNMSQQDLDSFVKPVRAAS